MYSTKKTNGLFHRRATVIVQTVLLGASMGISMAAMAVDTALMHSAMQELKSAGQLVLAKKNPLYPVEDSVQTMINEIIGIHTEDHLALESFARFGRRRMDLMISGTGRDLPTVLQETPDAANGGLPLDVNELKRVFQTLGGNRPVRLIRERPVFSDAVADLSGRPRCPIRVKDTTSLSYETGDDSL